MKNKLLLLVAILLSSQIVLAQSSQPNVDVIVDSLLYGQRGFAEYKDIVGASIGVYWKGKSHYYTYGYANKEKKIKVNRNTLFEIGSNTKIFTGLMFASEISKGVLTGDEYIDKYVDLGKGIRNKVRLIDLADFTSGLPTFHDSASLGELMKEDTTKDPLSLVTNEYTLNLLKHLDTLNDYGSYAYSNLGYGLLGYILFKNAHTTYNDLLQKEICKPLGLHHTTCFADTNSSEVAIGYADGIRQDMITDCGILEGAGIIKSDVVDMLKFIRCQLIVCPEMAKAIRISQKKYYISTNLQVAMGWHIFQHDSVDIYMMRGDTYGSSSMMLFDKKHQLGVVMLLNSANSGITSSCVDVFLNAFLDQDQKDQKRFSLPTIAVKKSILDTYAGVYEIQPGFYGTVTIDSSNTLSLQLTGQPKVSVRSVEDNWFVIRMLNAQLEFIRKPDGSCDKFIIHQNGQDVTCVRKKD